MSAKRAPAGGKDNILARLERSDAAPARRPWSRAARAGAAIGAAVTLGMVWLLAGLTQDSAPDHREAQVVVAAPAETQQDAASEPQAGVALDTRAEVRADTRAEPKPEPRTEARADPAIDPASLEPIPVLPMLADVVEKAPAAAAQAAAPRPAPRPARPHGAPRASASHAAARPAHPAQGAPARGADAGVESDVALLSAILIHAPRHSAERARAEAKCKDDKKCVSSPLPALLKATE